MSEGEMNERWVERIAEAVVQKLDERDQINAIAMQVLHLLDARTQSNPGSEPSAQAAGSGDQRQKE